MAAHQASFGFAAKQMLRRRIMAACVPLLASHNAAALDFSEQG
jgi:hypothetical protein